MFPRRLLSLTSSRPSAVSQDFSFELGSDEFKWRWETYSLGPKVHTSIVLTGSRLADLSCLVQVSADVLSKHLIMPLVSVTHLSFSSADPVSGISEGDLEKVFSKS